MKFALCLLVFSAGAVPALAEPPAQSIHYSGRWDLSDSSKPWCAWQGSSFAVSFSGQAILATIQLDHVEYIRVIVDGDHFNSRRLKLKSETHDYVLAENLQPGSHSVEVVKETYSGRGRLTLHALRVADGELIPIPRRKPRLRIQFYGDSNLAGHSLGHEKDKGGGVHTGCHFTFAGIAARMLDAEYQNISVGGARILGRPNSVMSFFDRMEYSQKSAPWQFDRFPADVCVLNIGANNVGRSTPEEISKDYLSLLRRLRKVHPSSHIVVMNGYGWDRAEPANYTEEVVEEFDDRNVSRLAFPWLFNEWHGCEYDHAGMAVVLAEHLATINPAWKAVRAPDVMSGFGRDGDVANGSFESVAPFGGYGWRYFEDGADRVHSPRESPSGEWYLRLPEGCQVHQPNPAVKSRTYTYRLKLRSPNPGTAKIRIEFRGQHFRSEIKDAAREFVFELQPEWKEYTVKVDSPPGTGDRSRDVWQIIVRIIAESGTVECDDVRLFSKQGS